MDTAFLTGATGFLGAHLARRLLDEGLRVRALVRPGSPRANIEGLPLELYEGDLFSQDVLAGALRGARYAFHLAADYRLWVRDPEALYRANVAGTESVLRAAGRAGVERIVHCSSVAAVRPPEGLAPSNEASEYGSVEEVVSHYKKSKFLSEQRARALAREGLPVVIVNPAAPVGPLDLKPTPTGQIIVDFLNGRIPSYIETGLNIVHAADVARGHYLAARNGRVGERYILGGENLSLKGVFDILARISGRKAPVLKTPYAVAYLFAAADTALAKITGRVPLAPLDAVRMARHFMWFDSSKAERELGYSSRPAEEALAEAVSYFESRGLVGEKGGCGRKGMRNPSSLKEAGRVRVAD